MSTLTWLHLSDIHFRESASYDTNIVLKPLLKDIGKCIRQEKLAPDFIAVTGDIAFSGKAAEYDLAQSFFDRLLKEAGLPKERLFIVPGNHDVEREAISVLGDGAPLILKNHDVVNGLLSDEDDRRLVLRRFRNYQNFVNQYFGTDLLFDDEHYFYVRFIDVEGQRIAILGLNSAWLSSSDEDRNRLLLGEHQVRAALDAAKDSDLCLALMHHPFDWLQDFDRNMIEPMLCCDCHFILHGHMHQVGLLRVDTPDTENMVVAAGACYASRDYPNSYNFVRLDLETLRGKVYLRVYSNMKGGFWTKDALNYQNAPDGVYEFQLPKIGMVVERLVSKLGDSACDPRVLKNLVCYGPRTVDKLASIIQEDVEVSNLLSKVDDPPYSALYLRTLRQRRALTALAHMPNKEATSFLKTLTPPGMLFIPAGSFIMGSNKVDNETPASEVWVNSFYLARVPVTNEEYREFIRAGGYHQEGYWTTAGWTWAWTNHREYPWRWSEINWHEQRDHPVQYISWYEATAYVRWLAATTGAPYRLPTEAEWEKAASWDNGTKREYPWGDVFDYNKCNLRDPSNKRDWTLPVGSLPAGDSPYGVADMAGQVWEWVSSLRKPYPYSPDDGREDLEAEGERVFRGGCWANDDPDVARCACRYYTTMPVMPYMNTDKLYDGPVGLRVALGFTDPQPS